MKNHHGKNALSFRLRSQGVLSQTSARFLYRFELFLFMTGVKFMATINNLFCFSC